MSKLRAVKAAGYILNVSSREGAVATTEHEQVISGLEGVLACESSVSFIDGPNGVLIYRGHDIHGLAEQATFEEVVFLLWHGRLPTRPELANFAGELVRRRTAPPEVLRLLEMLPATAHPMAALRTAVSAIGALDPRQEDTSREANLEKATRLVAVMPTLVAAMHRQRLGQAPVAPDPGLSHAANFLYMLTGERAADDSVRAVDTALILYADHELNASTFTARTTTSTQSDLYSAVVAGIAALKGPLHGGAVDDALRLFQEIGSVEAVPAFADRALAEKRKVPGFGHRVYRTADPRARHLKTMAQTLSHAAGDTRWYDIAIALEQALYERKRLNANVDYYASLVLYHLGFPLNLFTAFIVCSRVAGWCAHILEQQANNRLIRPRARYTGPVGVPFVPLQERG